MYYYCNGDVDKKRYTFLWYHCSFLLCVSLCVSVCVFWGTQDLPVTKVLLKLKGKVLGVLRLVLLEGRVLFYSKSAATASEAGEMTMEARGGGRLA